MKLFSDQERRGLIVLMPLLLVVVLLAVLVEQREPVELLDAEPQPQSEVELRAFDPNSDEYEQLRSSGVPSDIAVGIIRWRSYGKVYRIREDLVQVNGMTDSIYALLKPYIVIADSLAPSSRPSSSESRAERPSAKPLATSSAVRSDSYPSETFVAQRFLIDTVSSHYLTRWGLSPRQAEVVIRYRDASGGIFSEEQLRRCYVISDQMADRLLPYIIFSQLNEKLPAEENPSPQTPHTPDSNSYFARGDSPRSTPIEINSADSASLVSVDGIGAKSAHEILRYRSLLGGYYSVEQISELEVITEKNFNKILQQICCDSCKISKIDINFAGPKELERHPYVSARALRRIVKQRQLKGGWTRIEEMIDDDILSQQEAERLAPYLRFRLSATE